MIGAKYNKWIVILQEFYLEFISVKSKELLIFAKLISNFPRVEGEEVYEDMFVDGHIFLISTLDPWYEDIMAYICKRWRPLLTFHGMRDDDYIM